MPPNLLGHTMSGLRTRQAAVAGLKAVEAPSTSCESCQALSALFPIAGARAANTAQESHSDYTSDYTGQKFEFQTCIATNVATTESTVQKGGISGPVRKKKLKLLSV